MANPETTKEAELYEMKMTENPSSESQGEEMNSEDGDDLPKGGGDSVTSKVHRSSQETPHYLRPTSGHSRHEACKYHAPPETFSSFRSKGYGRSSPSPKTSPSPMTSSAPRRTPSPIVKRSQSSSPAQIKRPPSPAQVKRSPSPALVKRSPRSPSPAATKRSPSSPAVKRSSSPVAPSQVVRRAPSPTIKSTTPFRSSASTAQKPGSSLTNKASSKVLSSSTDSGLGALKSTTRSKSFNSTNSTERGTSVSPKRSSTPSRGNMKSLSPSPKPVGSAGRTSRGSSVTSGTSRTVAATSRGAPFISKAAFPIKSEKNSAKLNVAKDKRSIAPSSNGNGIDKTKIKIAENAIKDSAKDNAMSGNSSKLSENLGSTGESSEQEIGNIVVKPTDNEHNVRSVEKSESSGNQTPFCPPNDSEDSIGDRNYEDEVGMENGRPYAEDYGEEDSDGSYSEYSEYTDSESPEDDSVGIRVRQRVTVNGENNDERRLRFRRGQELPANVEDTEVRRKKFRRGRRIAPSAAEAPSENVKLRHQDVQGRKTAEAFMMNHVIEETVQKLVPEKKSKVQALVGAFETVISRKDTEAAR